MKTIFKKITALILAFAVVVCASISVNTTDAEASTKLSISGAAVTYTSTWTYTGSAIKPTVTVRVNGSTLTKGTDYSVSYSNNKKVGTATITIKGKGSYTGTLTKTFTIKPATVTYSTYYKNSDGDIYAKWKSGTGATYYQVQLRTTVNGSTSSWTTVQNSTKRTYSRDTIAYSSKVTVQIRVRGYKTVSGTTYYGSWNTITF